MHLLRRPRGLLFVTLAEPLLYPFRGIGGWRKDPYAENVPLGRLRLFGGPYPTVDKGWFTVLCGTRCVLQANRGVLSSFSTRPSFVQPLNVRGNVIQS